MIDHRSYTHNLIKTSYGIRNLPESSTSIISFSAVQINDLSYIHLHSSPSSGILRTHDVISIPDWLDSSVGRALHRYRRGHGLEFRSGLIFFRLKFYNCLSCDDQSCPHIFLRSSNNYMIFHIFTSIIGFCISTILSRHLIWKSIVSLVPELSVSILEAQTRLFAKDISLIQKSYITFLCLHCRWKNRRNIQTRIWKRWLSLHGLKTRFLWQHLSESLLNGQLSWCHSWLMIETSTISQLL